MKKLPLFNCAVISHIWFKVDAFNLCKKNENQHVHLNFFDTIDGESKVFVQRPGTETNSGQIKCSFLHFSTFRFEIANFKEHISRSL